MVSELSFSESSKGTAIADGFTLKIGQARAKSKAYQGNASLRSHQDSSEATRERGHLSIERAGNMQVINMGPNLIEKAKVCCSFNCFPNTHDNRYLGITEKIVTMKQYHLIPYHINI